MITYSCKLTFQNLIGSINFHERLMCIGIFLV